MHASADALAAACLDLSGVTAALHVATGRATLELFSVGGQLLLVTTANLLEPPGVRGAWTMCTSSRRWALVAVGTANADASLPMIRVLRRRRQVRAWLTRLGPFWVAEAAGSGLRLDVDNGTAATVARSRRVPGPLVLRQRPSRLHHQLTATREIS